MLDSSELPPSPESPFLPRTKMLFDQPEITSLQKQLDSAFSSPTGPVFSDAQFRMLTIKIAGIHLSHGNKWSRRLGYRSDDPVAAGKFVDSVQNDPAIKTTLAVSRINPRELANKWTSVADAALPYWTEYFGNFSRHYKDNYFVKNGYEPALNYREYLILARREYPFETISPHHPRTLISLDQFHRLSNVDLLSTPPIEKVQSPMQPEFVAALKYIPELSSTPPEKISALLADLASEMNSRRPFITNSILNADTVSSIRTRDQSSSTTVKRLTSYIKPGHDDTSSEVDLSNTIFKLAITLDELLPGWDTYIRNIAASSNAPTYRAWFSSQLPSFFQALIRDLADSKNAQIDPSLQSDLARLQSTDKNQLAHLGVIVARHRPVVTTRFYTILNPQYHP